MLSSKNIQKILDWLNENEVTANDAQTILIAFGFNIVQTIAIHHDGETEISELMTMWKHPKIQGIIQSSWYVPVIEGEPQISLETEHWKWIF